MPRFFDRWFETLNSNPAGAENETGPEAQGGRPPEVRTGNRKTPIGNGAPSIGERSGIKRTVGINLTWLTPGVVGGTEEHAVQLLRGLAALEGFDLDLTLYVRKEFVERYPDICSRWQVKTMPWPTSVARFLPVAVSKVARILFENSWLAVASRNDSMVHHLGGSVPILSGAPAIVTIHDLQPLDLPQNFSSGKRLWLRWILPRSVRRSQRTLCPSNFTAERVRHHLGIDSSKIEVVPFSCQDPTKPNSGQATMAPAELSNLIPDGVIGDEKLGDPYSDIDPFVLYPAIPYAHKRHVDIIDALGTLAANYPNLSAVFTGRDGPETAAIKERAERLGVSHRVHFVGRVPEPQLNWLYEHALAVIFPSSYEGFGNPVLEAMAHSCPVIVSSAGSLPEVVGDAGIVVNVGNVADYAAAIASLIDSPELAQQLAVASRARFCQADPGITAARTAAVYRDVLSSQS